MAITGQLKPLTSIKGIDVHKSKSIAISLVLNIVDRDIPRKITDRRNGVIKTIRVKIPDFIGSPWNLNIIPKR